MFSAKYIEHSIVKPDTQVTDIELYCQEAVACKFSTICVLPLFVNKAKSLTHSLPVKVATVIGFPFGHHAIEAKVAEIVLSILDGVDELQIVINSNAVKNDDWQYLANEINTVMPIMRNKGKLVTVILETGLMTDDEIRKACDLYGAAAVDFIKAGTGYVKDENLIERINFIRKHLADVIKIKATDAIINFKFADALIAAGADQLSCNNAVNLLQQIIEQN